MNSSTRLAKNTIIYAIGNFGSKFLAYAMVLVYSYYITPKDLGYYDIVLTTISMVQPLVIFQINDGVFRFLVDANKEVQSSIISNCVKFLCFTTIISEVVFGVICNYVKFRYAIWIGLLLASTMFFTMLQDVIRGLGKNKEYAFYGVINSLLMLSFEIVGLMFLNMGVEALIVSKVLAYVVCIFIMSMKHVEIRSAFYTKISFDILKPILKYSAPLIPNTICWWVVNSSDRYIILGFLGAASNGIYSMATKFPTILTTITSVFYLAWQESAIKEYHSENRDKFYSDIFQKYYVLLLSLCLCAIPATRMVIELFVSKEYKIAWQYTGFLYLGAALSALCSFLGMGYQISKETGRSSLTTVFAAVINFVVNIACVKMIGLQAACFSTFVAYVFLLIIRIQHSKRYFTLKIRWEKFVVLLIACIIEMLVVYKVSNVWLCLPLEIMTIFLLVYLNKSIFMQYIRK